MSFMSYFVGKNKKKKNEKCSYASHYNFKNAATGYDF